jgi:uncharacterized protein YdhG (YjbR/CyaY superfamily)
MAGTTSPKKTTAKKSTDRRSSAKKDSSGFTADERAAMKERARELKAEAAKADMEKDLLEKIKEMPKADKVIAERIHAIVKETAPDLVSKTWYGMPADANGDSKIICFFQPAAKFGARYATLGFNDQAQLDDGDMWPTSFAVKQLGAAEEKKIRALVKKAAR